MGSGLGAIVGGAFFDAGHPMMLWPVVTLACVVSLGGYWLLARRLPADVDAPEPAAPGRADDVLPRA